MPAKSVRTPEGDAKFFAALENGHPVRAACQAAGYARRCAYRWRKDDPAFATQWSEAMHIAGDLLEEEADRRGRDGYDEAVFYQEIPGTRHNLEQYGLNTSRTARLCSRLAPAKLAAGFRSQLSAPRLTHPFTALRPTLWYSIPASAISRSV